MAFESFMHFSNLSRLARLSTLQKVSLPHPFQSGKDQLAIGFKETRWNARKRGFDALCAVLEHSGVFHCVFLRDDIRYALAIDDSFSIESKQGRAQLWVKSLQAGPAVS